MLGRYINLKVIGGAVGLALILLIALLAFIWIARPDQTIPSQETAIVIVIPAPSETPLLSVPATSPTPKPGNEDTVHLGDLRVGSYVQVTGTAGTGLRLRVEPSLEAEIRLLGSEAEVFEVKEGPRQSEGYTWWYIVGPYDDTRRGWAVQDYLVVIQNP